MRRIDRVRRVEQAADSGLLDEPVEDIVDNMFEISEKPVNGVSRWRFVKSAVVPDESVLEFSRYRACSVDVLVVAMEKGAKEIRWLVNSCSPPMEWSAQCLNASSPRAGSPGGGDQFPALCCSKVTPTTQAVAVLSSSQHSSGEGSNATVSGSWGCISPDSTNCSLFD